jgi:hypothetical protein
VNYYVYYKVDPATAGAVRLAVEALFSRAQSQFGVRGRWMRRRDDPATYMEVYEEVADERGFEDFLQREGAAIAAGRKVERFVSA